MNRKKRTKTLLSFFILLFIITEFVGMLYRSSLITDFYKCMIQNISYVLFFCITYFYMNHFCSCKRTEYGLFFQPVKTQILFGVITGLVLVFMKVSLAGFRLEYALKDPIPYILVSQLLCTITEEFIFRGYLLTEFTQLFNSKDKAIFFSSVLFGLWHYPVGHNTFQCVISFLLGIFFCVLRTEFSTSVGLPALAIAHAICNISSEFFLI